MSAKTIIRYLAGVAIFAAYFPAKKSGIPLLFENGANAIETAGAYIAVSTIVKKPVAAVAVLATTIAAETAQYFGLMDGTYDPYDFLAYGVGVGTVVGLEGIVSKLSNKKIKN